MSDYLSPPELKRDEQLAQELEDAATKLQQAIHSAVEAGLKITVELESMHHVGHHYPEPLVEIQVERVIKLT